MATEDKKEQLAIIKIHELINFLAQNVESQDIHSLGTKMSELAVWTANFASQVGDAHALMNDLEHEYKTLVAEYIKDNGQGKGELGKAERAAELKYADKKKEYITWKNTYKKLSLKLESIDRIIDVFKQRVSALKQEMKHI